MKKVNLIATLLCILAFATSSATFANDAPPASPHVPVGNAQQKVTKTKILSSLQKRKAAMRKKRADHIAARNARAAAIRKAQAQ